MRRVIDLCVALISVVTLMPVFVIIAIVVKLESSGPAFIRQIRIGRRGRPFQLYKFRVMVDASAQPADGTMAPRQRLTRVGRLLRLTRIDGLPQLINVVKGDMSVVGPHPEVPSIVAGYTSEQRQILDVRPGITGPAQVLWLAEAARLPAAIDAADYFRILLPRKLELEVEYVRNQSLLGDARILLGTPIPLGHYMLARPRLGRVLKLARLATDCSLVGVATYAAFFARFDGIISARDAWILIGGLPFELVAYACAFLFLNTYRSIWRYSGVEDFWQVAKACAIGGAVNAAGMHMAVWPYPRSVLLLTPAFALLLLAGARLTWRRTATAFTGGGIKTERCRAVIVGAGRTGASVAREILGNPRLGYDVIGFVDDNRDLSRATLYNLPVLGAIEDLHSLTQKHRLKEAIIAIPRPTLNDLRRIQEACARAGLVFKTLPSFGQLVSGDGHVRYLRKVDLGNLLQRDTVRLQVEKLAAFLKCKRVMVTGAGGSIGSELCRQIVRLGVESLLVVDRAENPLFAICAELSALGTSTKVTAALADIKHIVSMSELFAQFRPQVVFHTAAYKHVPMLEAHPIEAVLNNVVGTARLAKLASLHAVETFVFISTDKAARPNNLMGATKRICELYLLALDRATEEQNAASKFRIVRFGNVLGSAGSAVPLFQRQIENGGPITITDPAASRFFMTIEEAVGLVLESTTLDTQRGVAVLDMGEPVKIASLADDLITALGLPPDDVPRQFIGLRPGEKLHEVLWDEMDEVLSSPHPRISIVRPRAKPLADMEAVVRQLEQLAIDGLVAPLLAKVQEIVPSYSGRDAEPSVPLLAPTDALAGESLSPERTERSA